QRAALLGTSQAVKKLVTPEPGEPHMDPVTIICVLIVLGVIVIAIKSRIRHRSLKRKNTGAPPPDLWRDYRGDLDKYERALRGLSYRDLIILLRTVPAHFRSIGLPAQSLPITQIETLLHIGDKPHGYELIEPAPLPVFPSLPPQPPADQPLPLWRRIF